MSEGVADLDFEETLWDAVHLLNLHTLNVRNEVQALGSEFRVSCELTVCSLADRSDSSKALLRAKGDTDVVIVRTDGGNG